MKASNQDGGIMKWAISIHPKIKAAFLLAIICLAILLNLFWEKHNISSINNSFSSIYKDRLLPATYVFHLTDHLYQKRLILEKYFHQRDSSTIGADRQTLMAHNEAIDTLLRDFEATYLVEIEDEVLHELERELRACRNLEQRYLEDSEKGAIPLESKIAFEKLFATAKAELTQLSQIQVDVGKKLQEDCQRVAASTSLLTNLDALLIIVIGLIIQVLIFTSKSFIPRVPQQHEWN